MKDTEVQARVARVETLLDALEVLPDHNARSTAIEAVQALMELYGEGLSRIMQGADRLGGGELLAAVAEDALVSHLLILHGLHPLSLEARVLRALREVRPYMASHGGNVEFLGVEGGVARLRLEGSCRGCHASTVTLKLAIERALREAAPELEGIEAEGVTEPPPRPLTARPGLRVDGEARWAAVGSLPQLSGGKVFLKEVSGEPLLFMQLEQDYYAYQQRCPGCGQSLAPGQLRDGQLVCAGCGLCFDVRRAGKCPDAPHLYLEPVPVLVSEQGLVQVALRGAAS